MECRTTNDHVQVLWRKAERRDPKIRQGVVREGLLVVDVPATSPFLQDGGTKHARVECIT